MAQSEEKESPNDPTDAFYYTFGYWEWNDLENDSWVEFDEPSSNQIECALKEKIEDDIQFGETIQILLSKGPIFGSAENNGVYVVSITMSWDDNQPVIESAFQKNTRTAHERLIRRIPSLAPPESTEQKQVL